MAKKLTAAGLNSLSKKYSEKKKIYILDGEYEIDIDMNFKPSDIDDLVMVYISALEELKSLTNVSDGRIKDTVVLLPTLLLRSFTNLPIPKKNTDIASLIILSKNLYNEGIIAEVCPQFPADQLKKVDEKISSFSKEMGRILSELTVKQAISDYKDIEVDDNAELQQSE